jgi:hypothetical protein
MGSELPTAEEKAGARTGTRAPAKGSSKRRRRRLRSARGRSLQEILEDPYVRNRSTPEERARLLERPELVAAIGRQTVADLTLALADAHGDRRGPTPVASSDGIDP